MNQLPESNVPYARHGRMWDDTLTGLQRLRRVDFLLGLGLNPARVPDGARIEYDPTTGEHRLQVINPGGHLVWVRRVWSPPPRPRTLEPISETLAAFRDAYAYPYADRFTEPPAYARGGIITDTGRAPAEPSTGSYVFPHAHRRGAYRSADVTIIDDPVRPRLSYFPALTASVDRWYNDMRAGRA